MITKINSRTVRLDVLAEDSDGKLYQIEIQRQDTVDHPRRVRYYGALADSEFLAKGKEYYELPDGSRPAEEFILSQGVKMRAKILMALEFLEEHGPALREPFSKSLGDGIFEVRAKQGI